MPIVKSSCWALAIAERISNDKIDLSALGKPPTEVFKARDLLVVYESEEDIIQVQPDFTKLAEIDTLGIIVTAPGQKVDFVSRFFVPKAGIDEDPVTGSAHCMLIPFWAKRLGKSTMEAKQVSKRGGHLYCEFRGQRVDIAGQAVTYLIGDISL